MWIRIVHLLIFVILIALIIYCFLIPGSKDREWVKWTREHLTLLLIMLAVNTVSFGLSIKEDQQDYYIKRQPENGQEKKYSFEAYFTGDDGGKRESFDIIVPAKRYKPKEAEEMVDGAFEYLDEHMKGENDSLDHVTKDLDISIDHDIYPVEITLKPSDYALIDEDGILRNEEEQIKSAGYEESDLLSGIPVEVNIRLSYGDTEKDKTYALTVFPKEKSDTEKTMDEIRKMYMRKEEESRFDDGFVLPASYRNVQIYSMEERGISPLGVLAFGGVVVVLLMFREAEQKKAAVLRKRQELLQAYPWFINEMVLLLGAGMQVRNVFSLLISDYRKNEDAIRHIKKKSDGKKNSDYRAALISELEHSKHDFEIGMSEGRVYYELGRRIKLPCYIKILTLLEQNATKGSKGLVAVLEQEERSALEERMNMAKKRGEEAGTRLLGPMILLLIIVMLIIMLPAFMSFT